ncbi:MAG: MmgE/PrpD family protein [Candidatus Eisenbacteria bacterium]|nr:MmgE/PrpD family protein [Candidatus Eisenbacteria bacterium]
MKEKDLTPTATEKLADYVARLNYEDLPEDVVGLAKSCLLDILGCAISGGVDEMTARAAKGAVKCHSGGDATAWAICQRASAPGAAMANAICAETSDFTYALGGTAILPAVLAVAEKEGIGGREVIVAIVAGHEVMWRIHKAVNQFSLQQRGFYPQGVCASFGPAAAVAKLLGLDAKATASAIGLAAGAGIGIRAYAAEGLRTKQFYLGTASASGVTIGYLAQAGMPSARLSLEAKGSGFFTTYAGTDYDVGGTSYKLGEEFLLRRTAFKLYPACRYVHTSIDAARRLASLVKPQEVERIEVRVPLMAAQVAGDRPVRSTYDAQFSIPWTVAVTLIDGTGLNGDQVSATRIQDRQVLALAQKVRVEADPELDRMLHGDLPPVVISCRMRILCRDGTEHSALVEYARGSAENPPTKEELHGKFEHLVEGLVSSAQAKKIEALVEDLEHLGDISSLIATASTRT